MASPGRGLGFLSRAAALVSLVASPWAAADVTPCTEDTYGLAGERWSRPYEPGVERLVCDFRYTDAAKVEKFTLNYYPSTQHFANFNGTDMVPERHWEYRRANLRVGLKQWVPGKNGPPGQQRRVQLAECELPQADGGAYIVQRVGPLVSHGNYDYWQYGWHDIWRLSKVLERHPEGIMFRSSFSGPVDSKGRVLGHPPIHIHHIHITPTPGVMNKMSGLECFTSRDPQQCYNVDLVVEQHGDYQCSAQDGGVDCFFEKTGDGHAKVVTTPLDLEGELNDVRAPDSEPMTWWYQVVLRWFPKTNTLRPLSQHFHVGPGLMNPNDQRHSVLVFPVNTSVRSVYWYTGRTVDEGTLIRNKLHAHNTMFDRAFWFRASARDLGLDAQKFWPRHSFRPLLLDTLGHQDFESLQELLFRNLAKAAERWDRSCRPGRRGCADSRPALVCQSWVSNEDFIDPRSGKVFAYDRRAPCCCRPWNMTKGDIFTVVAFLAPMKTPPGPWSPDVTPPTANMHIHWVTTWASRDNKSHYAQTTYCQNPDRQNDDVEDLSRYPVWRIFEGNLIGQGGLSNVDSTLLQRLRITARWLLVSTNLYWSVFPGTFVCMMLVFITLLQHLVQHCRRAKRVAEHPAVVCIEQTPCCGPEGVEAAVKAVRYAEVVVHED